MGDLAVIENADVFGGATSRAKILEFERAMIADKIERGEKFTVGNTDDVCPVTHHFAPGLYAREIFMRAGVRIVGKIHRHAHVNTISQGRVMVATEFGNRELAAPISFVSDPGVKRAVYAIEDTIWTTYHPTDETDLAKIEAYVIAPSFEALAAETQRAIK